MTTILYTEEEAKALSEKIHNFLIENRPRYNAERWSYVEPTEQFTGDKFDKNVYLVGVPEDYERWQNKLEVKEDIITTQELCVKYFDTKGTEIKPDIKGEFIDKGKALNVFELTCKTILNESTVKP